MPVTLPHSRALINDVAIASTSHEIEELERFRYEVYVEEQGKVIAGADSAQRRLRLASDDQAVHYYLRDPGHGGILGYARGHFGIFPGHLHAPLQLSRFDKFCRRQDLFFSSQLMVSPKARNLAVMRALTGAQYRHGRSNGVRAWLFHCRADLTPIYTRSGLYHYGPTFDLPSLGTHAPCIGICEDVDRFALLNSYFYPLTQEFENHDDFRLAFRQEFGPTVPKD